MVLKDGANQIYHAIKSENAEKTSSTEIVKKASITLGYLDSGFLRRSKNLKKANIDTIDLDMAVDAWIAMKDELNKEIWKNTSMRQYQEELENSIKGQ